MAKKIWAWLDTETTGLDPHRHAATMKPLGPGEEHLGARVIEVAVALTDDQLQPRTKNGLSFFEARIKLPADVMAAASPKALEVNGYSEERWADALTPAAAWEVIHEMVSGCHLVCQNVPFDMPMVKNELRLLGKTYPFDRRSIEIMSYSNLMSQYLGLDIWGLEPVYNALKARNPAMPDHLAHSAGGDVRRMMEVYRHTRLAFHRGVRLGTEDVVALRAERDALLAERDTLKAQWDTLRNAVAESAAPLKVDFTE